MEKNYKNIEIITRSTMTNLLDASGTPSGVIKSLPENGAENLVNLNMEIQSIKEENDLYENESDFIEYATEGGFFENEKFVEITYKENPELGMDGVVSYLRYMKNDKDKVTLVRKGEDPTSLIFDNNSSRRICSYSAAGQQFQICICTNKVKVEEDENGGEIFLDYVIEIHGVSTVHNIFTLKYKF